ncbi:Phosphotyrosine protein phosphatases superfamily protein [Euphorbia peplus]|nr:Phosphotyrosine protein phosphatases superfamily protein [Euphorbia peplus]
MAALKVLVDVRNHPVLIHCRCRKHRTGCLVGCFRKLQSWCLSPVFEEYRHFAGLKSRAGDLNFIENFDIMALKHCLYSIIYQYHGYGSNKRRLLYEEDKMFGRSHKLLKVKTRRPSHIYLKLRILSANNLTGNLPQSLSNLTKLTQL